MFGSPSQLPSSLFNLANWLHEHIPLYRMSLGEFHSHFYLPLTTTHSRISFVLPCLCVNCQVSTVHFPYLLRRQQPRLDKCVFACAWHRDTFCVSVCLCTQTCVSHSVCVKVWLCAFLFAQPASRINFLWHTIDWSWCYLSLISVVLSSVWTILYVLSLIGLVPQS